MRAALIALVALAGVSMPASSQISGTILREPIARTTISRLTILNPVNPTTGRRGQQNLTVQLTGLNTHFAQGTSTLSMGSGITVVSPLTVVSPTSASAVINIDAGTPAGSRTVTVTTGTEVISLDDGFTVIEPPDYFGDVCASATPLGTVGPGMSRTAAGWLEVAAATDYLTVSVPSGTILKLALTGVGAGSEFEFSVLRACWESPIASTTAGVSPKQIMLPAGNAPQTFVIRVSVSKWKAESSRFTLALSGEPLP